LALLIYDLYINIFLTGMFLWPLFRSRLANPRIRKMAMRTLVAAVAALTTSTINIAVLTIMHGQQLGWVCLGSCGTDVTMNALVLFWVTDNVSQSTDGTPAKSGGVAGVTPSNAIDPSLAIEEGMSKAPGRLALPLPSPRLPYADSTFDYAPRNSAGARSRSHMDSVVFSKERKRSINRGPRGGRILGRIGEAFRSKGEEEERNHQMSVQVSRGGHMHDDKS
jgi:hypothetical protein